MPSQVAGGQLIQSHHKYAKTVERKTLARQCPTLLTLLKAFPNSMELEEPTFKDIVVLYRRAMPPRVPPKASNKAPSKGKEERMQGILNYRNIYLKIFGETAMADMEVVFPEKKVGIKPFQYVNLVITVLTALITGVLTLWKAGDKINMNIVWTAASLILTRLFTVYSSAQTQKQTMQQQMSAMLYDKMQDSQEGVVSSIMEEMADQQVKQMLLAYTILLLKEGRPLLVEDLDEACEDMLVKDFSHKIDFSVEDALPRLKRWRLVAEDSHGKLVAMPLDEANKTLAAAWAQAYKSIGASMSTPTTDLITGAGSSFGATIDQWSKVRAEQKAKQAADEAYASKSTLSKTKDSMQKGVGSFATSLGLPMSKSKEKEGAAAAAAASNSPTPSGGGLPPLSPVNGATADTGGFSPSGRATADGLPSPSAGGMERASSYGSESGEKRKKGIFKKMSDKILH